MFPGASRRGELPITAGLLTWTAAWAMLRQMGRPATILEDLSAHLLSRGARSFSVEYRDGQDLVFTVIGDTAIQVLSWASSTPDAKQFRLDLAAAEKEPIRVVFDGCIFVVDVRYFDDFGEESFAVNLEPAASLDPAVAPEFTAKQGRYLAYIHRHSEIHGKPPSEYDLQLHFRVSPESVHEMIKTLERSGLIQKTHGMARSLRLLVHPAHLPRLA